MIPANEDSGAGLPLLLSTQQVAKVLGVGKGTALRLVSSGELPTVRIGRVYKVPAAELPKWIERQLRGAE